MSISREARPGAYLGAIGEFMRRKVDLSKRAFADQSPQRVVPHTPQVLG